MLHDGFSLLAVFDLSEVNDGIRRLSQKIFMMGNKYYGLGTRLDHLLEPIQGLKSRSFEGSSKIAIHEDNKVREAVGL